MMHSSSMLFRNTKLCTNINQFQLCAFSSKAPEMIKIEKVGEKQNVALIKLNRPKALNALCTQLMTELANSLETQDTDKFAGAIDITGSERAFAAGADIKEMTYNEFVSTFSGSYLSNWTAVSDVKKPVIAAVNGFALGCGNELAMMCDTIYAGEKARFGQPESNIGTITGAGGTERWARAAEKSFVIKVCLTGNHVSAQKAKEHGIVSEVFPVDQVVGEAVKLGEKSADQSPLIVQVAKETVNKAYGLTLQEGLHFRKRLFHTTFAPKENKKGSDFLRSMLLSGNVPSQFTRSHTTRAKVIDSLKARFKGEVTIKDLPAIKISVKSSSFKSVPRDEQRQEVIDVLPEDWKQRVIIETFPSGSDLDREVRPVRLRDVIKFNGENVTATPQSLLDDSVFMLKQNNGLVASELLWLCGSLSLKNFAHAYRKDPTNHLAKNHLVSFISAQFGDRILDLWMTLNSCHQIAYEDKMTIVMIKRAAKNAELFCNLLYEYHCSKKFNFDEAIPDSMLQRIKTKNGRIKKIDFFFRSI